MYIHIDVHVCVEYNMRGHCSHEHYLEGVKIKPGKKRKQQKAFKLEPGIWSQELYTYDPDSVDLH